MRLCLVSYIEYLLKKKLHKIFTSFRKKLFKIVKILYLTTNLLINKITIIYFYFIFIYSFSRKIPVNLHFFEQLYHLRLR
jgi:hypothetical protein